MMSEKHLGSDSPLQTGDCTFVGFWCVLHPGGGAMALELHLFHTQQILHILDSP